jgi:small subunit ribosomal protein S6
MNNYETVFILTPVLSDDQMKDTVTKFTKILKDNGSKIINEESWGLKKLAYPIQHKSTGFYNLVEFEAAPETINKVETEFRRDEKIMRFLTVSLDKHALAYNVKRRNGEFNKDKKEKKEKETAK